MKINITKYKIYIISKLNFIIKYLIGNQLYMRIVFTLVLYNNSYEEIQPLIESINKLNLEYKKYKDIILSINDNSNKFSLENQIKENLNKNIIFYYTKNKNIGFGKGHNCAFKASRISSNLNQEDILIVVNPDVYFLPKEIGRMIDFINQKENKKIVCIAPLIFNEKKIIQYSAKQNPTILSLLISRIKPLERIGILKKYISKNQNRSKTLSSIFESEYLSGCFLLIRAISFSEINGFDETYFLHFEDADLTRTLSKLGKCIHYPYSQIIHRWNRGSHKSFRQTILLIQSMINYFRKWGLKLF